MKDNGKLIYEDQLKFNKILFENKGVDFTNMSVADVTAQLKEYILNVIRESTEALDTRKFKMHRVENKEEISSNTIEELIDCQKYLWGAFQLLGVNWDSFVKEYWRKTKVVEQRYFQEHLLHDISKDKKVVALDLDGVLCEYPKPWIDYVNIETANNFKTLEEVKDNIDVITYTKLKSQYRQSGLKRYIKPTYYAKEFTETLKSLGYWIVIITSRPYKQYYRLYSDTLEWLENNNISYDALYFEEQKNLKIIEEIPNLSFMVEDNKRYANSIAKLGYNVYYLGNDKIDLHKHVNIVNHLGEILIKEDLYDRGGFDPLRD